VRLPLISTRRTLRTRLTVLLATLLLIGFAVVGVVSTLALRTYLMNRLDAELVTAGSRYAQALEHDDSDADNVETSTVGQSEGTLGARLLAGKVTAVGVIAPANAPITVSAADLAVIARLSPTAHTETIALPTLGHYRVMVSGGRDGDVLVTGLPTHPIEETLHHTVLAELAVLLGVLLVMVVVGAVAVRRSLLPLQRVAATALRVSDLPLATGDGRVPERAPMQDEQSEVGQVARAVNQLLGRVEDALMQRQRSEERLRRFVADASHELRTPLSVVRSHSELVQQIGQDLPEELRHSLRRIDAESARMGRLVDDLLLLARLDSGQQLEHQPVDLSVLVIDAVTDARVAGPDHSWQLDLPEEPVTVIGDRHRLPQVVANLLANARNHTGPGTVVTTSLSNRADGTAVLSVHDTGPGIPPELLPTVSERFVRGDAARTHRNGSTGLGLAIVAGIATAHGGSLSIESSPGNTCVTVTLPAASSTAFRDPSSR
jgi:two-component system OmpR family sensor kinase